MKKNPFISQKLAELINLTHFEPTVRGLCNSPLTRPVIVVFYASGDFSLCSITWLKYHYNLHRCLPPRFIGCVHSEIRQVF